MNVREPNSIKYTSLSTEIGGNAQLNIPAYPLELIHATKKSRRLKRYYFNYRNFRFEIKQADKPLRVVSNKYSFLRSLRYIAYNLLIISTTFSFVHHDGIFTFQLPTNHVLIKFIFFLEIKLKNKVLNIRNSFYQKKSFRNNVNNPKTAFITK